MPSYEPLISRQGKSTMRWHEIHSILAHRIIDHGKRKRGRFTTEYLVKWVDSQLADSWEPERNVQGLPALRRYDGKEDGTETMARFVVEKICEHAATEDGEILYLVKWKGYKSHMNTWEPVDSFENTSVLENYLAKKSRVVL